MCAKLPCALTIILNGNNTQEKINLQKTKVNSTKITKVHTDRNKLHTRKEWRALAQ